MRKIIALCLLLASPLFAQNAKVSEQGAASGTFIPTGVLLPYAGCKAVGAVSCNTVADGSQNPPGWLLAYGQAVSRTTYKNLWNTIGTTYGSGDGTTTFNLPDCRGRSLAGRDNMGGVAAGRITLAKTIDGTQLAASGGSQADTPAGTVPGHYHTFGALTAITTGATSLSGTTTFVTSVGAEAGHTHTPGSFRAKISYAGGKWFGRITDGVSPSWAATVELGGSMGVSSNTDTYGAEIWGTTSGGSSHGHGVGTAAVGISNSTSTSGCIGGSATGACTGGTTGNNAMNLTGTEGNGLPPTLIVNCIIKI